jgi:branched-chain amino acid transport system substrate-binding protein
MKHLRFLLLTLFFFALDISSVCAEPLKIGAALHLSGEYAPQGAAFREGIELAASELNASADANGAPIQLFVEDTQYIPKIAFSAAKRLLNINKVAAVIIGTFAEAKAINSEFEKNKIPLIVLWDSNPKLEEMGEYVFAIGPWTPSSGEHSAEYAFNILGKRKAVVIGHANEWSLSVSEIFAKKFTELGGTVLHNYSLIPEDADFRAALTTMRTLNPDVVYAPVSNNIPDFFKQYKELNFSIPVITSDNLNDETIKIAGQYLEGVYQTQVADPTQSATAEMAEKYKSKYQKPCTMPLFVGWGYDAVKLIALAASKGDGTPQSIQKELYKIKNYQGASGVISINEKGSSPMLVNMYQIKNGQFIKLD